MPWTSAACLDRRVDTPSRKRVRDVVWHIAQWEATVAASIEAGWLGGELRFDPFDIDAINARMHQRHATGHQADLDAFLTRSRESLLAALTAKPPQTEVLLPWGRKESLEHVAKDMLQHEQHHYGQIERALPEF